MTDTEILNWLIEHKCSLITDGSRWVVVDTDAGHGFWAEGFKEDVLDMETSVAEDEWSPTPQAAVERDKALLEQELVDLASEEEQDRVSDLDGGGGLSSLPKEDLFEAHHQREMERIGLMDQEQLLHYMYVFVVIGHKALQPWRSVLDRWKERVEELTGWEAWGSIEASKYANPYPGEYPYDPATRSKLQADLT